MVQSEDNLKIIRKYDKNNLINNFLENISMHLKKEKYIWLMSHLFQRTVMIFLWFLVAQKWWKANITLKHSIISKAQLKSQFCRKL